MSESTLKVLLIEDDEDDYILVRKLLSQIGSARYEIDWVQTYADAIEATAKGKHDVCLVDYRLGERNGIEILEAIRGRGDCTPAIFLTGHPNFDVDMEAMKAGADDYLVKGQISADLLERSIRYAVERSQAAEALRESEERLKLAMEAAQLGAWDLDLATGTAWRSLRHDQIFGYDSLLPHWTYEMFLEHVLPEDRAEVDRKFREAVKGGRPGALECRIRRADGVPAWIWVQGHVRFDDGKPVRIQGLIRDITEQRYLEEQLRQAQKMEAIGTLAGGIAHDFNNILAAILGNAEIALEDTAEDGPRHNLQQILRATVRGRDLVKQILTYSRRSERERRILHLSPLVKETFTLLRASLPTTIQMKLDLRASPDVVHADPSQIQQVIMNLITNAAYAMREKGGTLEVSLDSAGLDSKDLLPDRDMTPGQYLVLSAKDTGCGMGESVRKRIFEPFFSTKEKGEGTGLGLSVVYGIVKGHGGGIAVWSEPGQGSLFTVYLPAAMMDEKGKGEGSSAGAIPGGTERILFVDDEEAMAELGQATLAKLGYEVIATKSSMEAFTLFMQDPKRFDLVITDQTMPEMTGLVLATKLLKERPGLPVILCTGYSENISRETAKETGIREFVMKPASKKEMAEAVRRALAGPESS
jgi:PAS domain S-box-containing protein